MSIGLLFVVTLFYVVSQGENAYIVMQKVVDLWYVKFVYWGFIYALFFHLCHGIRHLFWDLGAGFEAGLLEKYAKIELALALLLTVFTWIFI